MRFSLSRMVRDVVMRRVVFAALVAGVPLALLGGVSLWTVLLAQAPVNQSSVTGSGQRPGAGGPGEVVLVLTSLVAREISPSTSSAVVRAATAQLLEQWKGLYLQQVEAQLAGMEDLKQGLPSVADSVDSTTLSMFLRADEGWVDSVGGNLVLCGNIHGLRSDGLAVTAKRLEYEPGVDEVRLFETHVRSPEMENQAPVAVIEGRLKRIRFLPQYKSRNSFFQSVQGG